MNNRMRTKQKLKYKIASYKIDPYQISEAHMAMSLYIFSMLKAYQKYPRMTYPGFDEADTLEKWNAVIEWLIDTFYQIVKDYPDSPMEQAFQKIRKEHSEAISFNFPENRSFKIIDNFYTPRIKPGYEELYKHYVTKETEQKEKAYRQKIQEGLQLFAKFFPYIQV